MSPFEHCAKAMSDEEYYLFRRGKGILTQESSITVQHPNIHHLKKDIGWCNNFKGFIQYRYLIENDIIKRSK